MKGFQPKQAFILSAFLFIAFLLIGFTLHLEAMENLDTTIGRVIYQFADLDSFFIFLSFVGSRTFFYPALIVLTLFLLYKKNFPLVLLLWLNLLGVRLLNTILKKFYVRERPSLDHVVDAGYYSFPSGHSMNSFAFFGLLALLLVTVLHKKSSRFMVLIGSALLIILIGFSRIYLGVHFPLDVVAGFLAGAGWLTFMVGIWLKWINKK